MALASKNGLTHKLVSPITWSLYDTSHDLTKQGANHGQANRICMQEVRVGKIIITYAVGVGCRTQYTLMGVLSTVMLHFTFALVINSIFQ